MPGTPFTQRVDFGIGTGPTYSGSLVTAAPAGGNNGELISQAVAAAVSGQSLALPGGAALATILDFGFKMQVTALNGATDPTVTIHIALSAGGPVDIVLHSEESVAVPTALLSVSAALLAADITGITVDGDALADCVVYGIVNLTV